MTSTARLQREADASRVELADTLGQLRDGLAPSALSTEAIALVKDSGLSLIKTLAEQARANPVPALLIGAGLTMLLTRTTGSDVMGVASSTLKSAAATGAGAARSAASATAATASSAAATVASAASRASSAASSVTGAVRDAASAVGDRVANTIGEVQHQASEGYAAMKDKVDSGIEAGRREMHDRRDQAAGLADTAQEKAATPGRSDPAEPVAPSPGAAHPDGGPRGGARGGLRRGVAAVEGRKGHDRRRRRPRRRCRA